MSGTRKLWATCLKSPYAIESSLKKIFFFSAFTKLTMVKKLGVSVGNNTVNIGNLGLRLQMMKVKQKLFDEFDGHGVAEVMMFIVRFGKGGDEDHAA